jgi:hypothetical protein
MKHPIFFSLAASLAALTTSPTFAAAAAATSGITAITVTSPVHQFLADRPGTVVLNVSVTYQGSVSRLGVRLVAPAAASTKWTFVSATGPIAQPLVGDNAAWEFSYPTTPTSPVTFSVVLNYASGLANPTDGVVGSQTFTASALQGNLVATDTQGNLIQTTLTLTEAVFHTADANVDMRLRLDELLKVIQIYNTRNVNTRTGAYDANFAPLPNATPVIPAKAHSADLNKDGAISLMELLRVLDLCTYTSSGIRTGEYRADSQGVDGFSPGP